MSFTIIIDYKKNKARVQPNFEQRKEVVKIGKEINLYKRKDGANPKEIERRFAKDANKMFVKKLDPTLSKQIAKDVVDRLKRR